MKTCPKCKSHKVIMFDSNNDLCETCNKWFPAVADEPDLKPYNKELITKLADDVWAVAKKLEGSLISEELKTISGCLHNIRANQDTDWYKKFKVKNKEEKMQNMNKKNTLADEMNTITTKVQKIQEENQRKIDKEQENKNKKNGQSRAKEIIAKLPARIKTEAKKGKSCIYEDCWSSSKSGSYMLTTIHQWAQKQGFKTDISYNNEPYNEGGEEHNILTISWKPK